MAACRLVCRASASFCFAGALLYLGSPWDPRRHGAGPPAPSRRLRAEDGKQPLRPNIVWVMADDLGVGEVGLFAGGSPHGLIATPHLDQFGKEGMIFTDAYSGYTVCAPSRFAFYTGLHSGHFNRTNLIFSGDESTVVKVLKQAGYATGAFGKLGPMRQPLLSGFDAFLGQVHDGSCHNMYPAFIDEGDSTMNVPLSGNLAEKSRELCMAHPEKYNYTVDVFHDAALSWMSSVADGSAPFFLYYSLTVPHAGGWGDRGRMTGGPVPTGLHYTKFHWPDSEKDHAAAITYMDRKIGQLLQHIRDLGVDNQTLVIFASDNGAHNVGGHDPSFFNSTAGLRGYKRSLFEGGTRSPTMARWPGVVPPGRRSKLQWAFWDALPSFAELAGASAPDGIDGRSIVPTLLGHTQPQPEYLFWTYRQIHQRPPGYAIRVEDWKGIVPVCSDDEVPTYNDTMQLYDLSLDPFEATDVAERHPEVVRRLMRVVVEGGLKCQCFQCFTKWEYDPVKVAARKKRR